MTQPNYLDVSIMGREYRVACAPEEREALLAAVAHVDQRMREIADKSKAATPERVAVMAALNIAHEALSAATARDGSGAAVATAGFDIADAKRRIGSMEARLDAILQDKQNTLFD